MFSQQKYAGKLAARDTSVWHPPVCHFSEPPQDYAGKLGGRDVIFLMGSDFTYAAAESWFRNLDKLIHYVNLVRVLAVGLKLAWGVRAHCASQMVCVIGWL
jgi:hypothetical protein